MDVAELSTVRTPDVAAVVDHGICVDSVECDVVLVSVSETVYIELTFTGEASSFTLSFEVLAIAIIVPTSAAVKRMAAMQMAMKHRIV